MRLGGEVRPGVGGAEGWQLAVVVMLHHTTTSYDCIAFARSHRVVLLRVAVQQTRD